MGHIRLGRLPKTRQWSGVFKALGGDSINIADLSRALSIAAQKQFAELEGNRAISFCFWVLVRVATASRGNNFIEELSEIGLKETNITSGLSFVQHIGRLVEKEVTKQGQPSIFVRMAELSLREILSYHIGEKSRTLFGTDINDIQKACKAISTQAQFGKVAMEFFARFMSHSIRYLTDKELSNFVGPDKALSSPSQALDFHQYLDQYCSESAKIVQEYAAGWFSKQNWESNNNISQADTISFTAYALQKIIMDLQGTSS